MPKKAAKQVITLATPAAKKQWRLALARTLRKGQADAGGFAPSAWQNKDPFRSPSNPTLKGYSTGYHESAVTTDTFNFLRQAVDLGNGTHKMPLTTSAGPLQTIVGKKVNSTTLEYILKYADGFRTDTAQTILSAPQGKAAGHSGSGINTRGQDKAHHLLRRKIVEILQLKPTTTGFTERSVVVLLGSMTVTSMAPGVIARTVEGGTASLKAGPDARQNWEVNRNEAKRITEAMFRALSPNERAFVREHAISFLDSTQSPSLKPRRISPSRATSPERAAGGVAGKVAGGDYLPAAPTLGPRFSPPAALEHWGLHMTDPFRAERR